MSSEFEADEDDLYLSKYHVISSPEPPPEPSTNSYDQILFGDDFEDMTTMEPHKGASTFCSVADVDLSFRLKINGLFGTELSPANCNHHLNDSYWIEAELYMEQPCISQSSTYLEGLCESIVASATLLQPKIRTRPRKLGNLYVEGGQGWNEWLTFSLRYCDLNEWLFIKLTLVKDLGTTNTHATTEPNTAHELIGSSHASKNDSQDNLTKESILKASYTKDKYAEELEEDIEKLGELCKNSLPKILFTGYIRLLDAVDDYQKVKQGIYQIQLEKPCSPSHLLQTQATEATGKLANSNDKIRFLKEFTKKYEDGETPIVRWLDKLTCPVVGKIMHREAVDKQLLYLLVELQRFDYPLLIEPYQAKTKSIPILPNYISTLTFIRTGQDQLQKVLSKYRQAHHRSIQPGLAAQEFLNDLIRNTISEQDLSMEDRALVWKFRDWLTKQPRSLALFLKCVDWDDFEEMEHVINDLVPNWPVLEELEDVFDLIALNVPPGSKEKFTLYQQVLFPKLQSLTLEEIQLHLSVLVDVYTRLSITEDFDEECNPTEDESASQKKPSNCVSWFGCFLVEKGISVAEVGSSLYWYLRALSKRQTIKSNKANAAFNYCGIAASRLLAAFLRRLSKVGLEDRVDQYLRQEELLNSIGSLVHSVKNSRSSTRIQRLEIIRNYICEPGHKLATFAPIPLPLDPAIMVMGINHEKLSIFKSNALPVKIPFICTDYTQYQAIFKTGDDLRQDQLVLYLIDIMDRIWKREGLDLRLTPYKTLPVTQDDGLVQFIPSEPLANILENFSGSIRSYFRFLSTGKSTLTSLQDYAPDEFDSLPIDPVIMENYIRSCAGYSVLTYVLGIGDRHLENLLLTERGHLFHIDFAYLFGRDPKPFPPPMKLCREMVEAMGGLDSEQYRRFKALAHSAFVLLRRHAKFIIASLLLLTPNIYQTMPCPPSYYYPFNTSLSGSAKNVSGPIMLINSSSEARATKINDSIDIEQPQQQSLSATTLPLSNSTTSFASATNLSLYVLNQATLRATTYVQERLALGRSDEAALLQFEQLIDSSVNALFPQVMEAIHKWAQYWRK